MAVASSIGFGRDRRITCWAGRAGTGRYKEAVGAGLIVTVESGRQAVAALTPVGAGLSSGVLVTGGGAATPSGTVHSWPGRPDTRYIRRRRGRTGGIPDAMIFQPSCPSRAVSPEVLFPAMLLM